MTTDAPKLISFALTGTLADIDGVSHVERICRASPLSRDEVRRILNGEVGLKTIPTPDALTPALIAQACIRLRISRGDFPFGILPLAPYRLRADAVGTVAAAAQRLDTAIITNTSVFAEPCLAAVREELAPHLAGLHASWSLGVTKPDPEAFRASARRHGANVTKLIHIGHSWRNDVAPVLASGGRAVWLNPDRALVPGADHVPPGRLLVANSLAEAVSAASRRWLG